MHSFCSNKETQEQLLSDDRSHSQRESVGCRAHLRNSNQLKMNAERQEEIIAVLTRQDTPDDAKRLVINMLCESIRNLERQSSQQQDIIRVQADTIHTANDTIRDLASRAIVIPDNDQVRPTVLLLDITGVDSQLEIYDRQAQWTRLYKVVEGQRDHGQAEYRHRS